MRAILNSQLQTHLVADADKQGVQKLVVGAVIKKEEKFLLLERTSAEFMGGLVELPSGSVEPGENLIGALCREVMEETGLEIKSVQKYLGSFDYVSGSGKKARQFNFLVETKDGPVVLNPEEHSAFFFVDSSDPEFATLKISDATKEVLNAAN